MSNLSRHRTSAVVVITLIFVAALAIFVFTRQGEGSQTVAVTRGGLAVTIETVGKLQARNPNVVRSAIDGTVATVAVSPGDEVQEGDVLATIDRKPIDDAIQLAEQQLADAEAALTLAEQRGGDNPSPEQTTDRLAASQRVQAARLALGQAQDKLPLTLIQAERSGTVTDVSVAENARIPGGAPVATVVDLTDLELHVEINEIDLPHISAGMAVKFSLDAYPSTEIEGSIVRISPTAQTTGGTTTFPTSIAFQRPADFELRPGMNASVTIQTSLRQDVLLVPEQALRTVGRRTFVTVVRDGDREEREIQIGLRSNGQVEVAQGLQEGERVLLR